MSSKFWLVAAHEYGRHVKRKRFIFALLSMPFFILLMIAISLLNAYLQYNGKPTGVIDRSGMFTDLQAIPSDLEGARLQSHISFISFGSNQLAEEALTNGEIQAYVVIEENYLDTGEVTLFYKGKYGPNVLDDLRSTLRYNLLLTQPEDVRLRMAGGSNLIIRTPDGTREMAQNNLMVLMLPILVALLFVLTINFSGGYLVQATVEEKENRTMEMIITSLPSRTLMAAKIIGNLAIGLTQMVFWLLFGWAAIAIAGRYLPFLQNLHMDLTVLLILVLLFLPAFVMVGALMAMVGAVATESSEAQQVAGLFSMPVILPFWFSYIIMVNPNGPIAVGLSLFPLTAPVAMAMRATVTVIPTWQVVLCLAILVFGAWGAVWLASQAFHLGLLRYGKKVSFKELFRSKAQVGHE